MAADTIYSLTNLTIAYFYVNINTYSWITKYHTAILLDSNSLVYKVNSFNAYCLQDKTS